VQIGITGIAAWTAAGDLPALAELVAQQGRAFRDPPYPSEGLRNPLVGAISELDRDRPAEALLRHVVGEALAQSGRAGRTGLIVGTSSGNICGPWERWHRAELAGTPADEAGTGRDAPTLRIAEELGLQGPIATLSVACVSGTAVLAVAEGWLRDGLCDRVVAAGLDALSLFVHAGFSGLGALTATLPRPFEADRDGLLLGEGAAALVLEPRSAAVYLGGVGLSADAVHMTAPDRHAGGAIRALRSALDRAGLPADAIHTVSVHGTATPFNDAMEQVAMDAVLPHAPPMQLVKRAIGHTMGAAGAVEAALAAHTLGERPGAIASMSSAFGGMNAAAVFCDRPAPTPPSNPTQLDPHTYSADLQLAWPDAPLAIKRGNHSVRAALAALKQHTELHGPLDPATALVLSTRTGCRPTDLRYHERLVREGTARASRLQFTYTVPAAPICEASLRFGLHGPLLAFIGPASVGVDEAQRLVRYGHAPAALALDIEDGCTEVPTTLVSRG